MARSLTPALVTEKNRLHSTNSWFFLIELVVDDVSAARITSAQTNITFDGNVYYAFPVAVGPIESNAESRVASFTITVSNMTREVQAILDGTAGLGDGLTRKRVFVRLVNSAQLADPQSVLLFDYRIISATSTWNAVTFTLGTYDLWSKESPKRRYVRAHCAWTYKGPECGYTLNIASCDKTLSGGNGCKVHGDDEVANGQPRSHPRRYGGWPGLPKGRT